MGEGDIIIDGGNSYYRDDIDRAAKLRPKGIHYVDVRHERWRVRARAGLLPHDRRRGRGGRPPGPPCSRRIAPGLDAAPRTEGMHGRHRRPPSSGYLHCGPNGAGHFVKMVHNGIEYGLMAAYAEGLDDHQHGQRRQDRAHGRRRDHPAPGPGVLPVRHRHRRGGRGLAAGQRHRLLAARPHRRRPPPGPGAVDSFGGRVSDSGEGRWTVLAAVDEGVPADVSHCRPVRALLLPRRGRVSGNRSSRPCARSSAATTRRRTRRTADADRPDARWAALAAHHDQRRLGHLRQLFADDPDRGSTLTVEAGDLHLDYSKHRLTAETSRLLRRPRRGRRAARAASTPCSPASHINITENRPVLHVALRMPREAHIFVDGHDVVADVHAVLDRMGDFSDGSATAAGRATPASASATSSTSASAAPTSARPWPTRRCGPTPTGP